MDFIAYLDHEISNLCPQPEYFDLSPFGLTDFRDCFIMELIKDAYFKSEPKQSLRTNRGNDDDDAEQQVGECVDGIGAAHDEPVHPAADQSGRSANGDADHRGEQRAGECDQK